MSKVCEIVNFFDLIFNMATYQWAKLESKKLIVGISVTAQELNPDVGISHRLFATRPYTA